jgi:hypothetical protein
MQVPGLYSTLVWVCSQCEALALICVSVVSFSIEVNRTYVRQKSCAGDIEL